MLGLGLGLSLGVRNAGPSYYDPAGFAPDAWWRASYTGSPWVGTASDGASGSKDLTEATNPPTAGSGGQLVNGFAPAVFDGTNDQILWDVAISGIISADAYTWWVLFMSEKTGGAGAGDFYFQNPALWSDGAAWSGCSFRNASGTEKVGAWHANAGSNRIVNEHTITLSTYGLLVVSYDGTKVRSRFNEGSVLASADFANVGNVGNGLVLGRNYNSTAFAQTRVLDIGFKKTANDVTTVSTNLLDYGRGRYALPLT